MRRAPILVLLALAPVALPAAEGLAWLKIPQGARSVALGTAVTALSDGGAEGQWYTPAALGGLERPQLSVSRQAWLGQTRDDYVGLAAPLGPGALGLYGNLLATEDVTRDAFGNAGAKFNNSAWSAGLGYGLKLGILRLGVAGKMVQESLAGTKGSGFAADLGAQIELGSPKLRLGAAAQNLGSFSGYQAATAGGVELPLCYRAGLALDQLIPHTLLSAELRQLPLSREQSVLAGAELGGRFGAWTLALRGGYEGAAAKVGDLGGLALGAGVGFQQLRVDFAYTPYGALGDPYRMSLAWDFGGAKAAAGAPAAELSPEQRRERARALYTEFQQAHREGRKADAVKALEAKLALIPDAAQQDWLQRYKALP
jgi:hypothetical protein